MTVDEEYDDGMGILRDVYGDDFDEGDARELLDALDKSEESDDS